MEYADCLQQIQKYLENRPVVILGSGSSAAYGLPSMDELGDELKKHRDKFENTAEFDGLCSAIDQKMGLEAAIDRTALSDASFDALRKIVWAYINKKDRLQFERLIKDRADYALADLLKIIGASGNTATIMTTNYDRLAEYAADIVGATATTGFSGHLIKKLDMPIAAAGARRAPARGRAVNIWKVHGSLDWFINGNGEIVSYPLQPSIPKNHTPLIIPPGKGKYNHTHDQPYRDVIAQADSAFSSAGSFLCVGYGFNDSHIQPKLIEQIKKGKPIVVICKSVTKECKRNVIAGGAEKYAVIAESGGRTAVHGPDYSEIYDGSFWCLDEFIKTVWGGA